MLLLLSQVRASIAPLSSALAALTPPALDTVAKAELEQRQRKLEAHRQKRATEQRKLQASAPHSHRKTNRSAAGFRPH